MVGSAITQNIILIVRSCFILTFVKVTQSHYDKFVCLIIHFLFFQVMLWSTLSNMFYAFKCHAMEELHS